MCAEHEEGVAGGGLPDDPEDIEELKASAQISTKSSVLNVGLTANSIEEEFNATKPAVLLWIELNPQTIQRLDNRQ